MTQFIKNHPVNALASAATVIAAMMGIFTLIAGV